MQPQNVNEMSEVELRSMYDRVSAEYESFKARNLSLNMARGKPSPELLDLNTEALTTLDIFKSADGTDARNYGVLEGLPEMRQFFGEVLNLDPERIIIGGNSSLNLMYDTIMRLYVFGTGGHTPWGKLPKLKFLCPSPGYDRHFAVTQEFGFELITIPMTSTGPDMDMVEKLVAADAAIKGIWCVPLYSNPQGICFSDETVKRLGKMVCAAPDFRIFWDNAYGVHHLYDEETALYDIFRACEEGGNPERAYYFFSTSKITFPGAGVAMMACGYEERREVLKHLTIETIGYDKLNQLRTLKYLKNAENLKKHMKRLAAVLRPKFDIVINTLQTELGGRGFAQWTSPRGGYFVAVDTNDNCAKATVALAKAAGVTMTGAGATFPGKNDPRDRNIRIAPSYPSNAELQQAMDLFCVCVKLACLRHKLGIND